MVFYDFSARKKVVILSIRGEQKIPPPTTPAPHFLPKSTPKTINLGWDRRLMSHAFLTKSAPKTFDLGRDR